MPSSDVTMTAPAADFSDTGATRTLLLPKKGKSLFDRSPKPRAIKLSASDRWLRGISYVWISLFALFCLLPFVLIVSASFSSESAIRADGFGLWPKEFTFAAYELIFQAPKLEADRGLGGAEHVGRTGEALQVGREQEGPDCIHIHRLHLDDSLLK